MSVNKPSNSRLKAVCSVSEMARAVGLSRASFYAYIKRGVFLAPIYSAINHRPLYTADMQAENIAVRQSGLGVNNEYVLFYEKHPAPAAAPQPARKDRITGLLDSIKALGLEKATQAQINDAVAVSFPDGIEDVDDAVVLRVINRHLRRSGLG